MENVIVVLKIFVLIVKLMIRQFAINANRDFSFWMEFAHLAWINAPSAPVKVHAIDAKMATF